MNPIPIHAKSRYHGSARYGWLWYVEEEKKEERRGGNGTANNVARA
jgi:hypothetical protein